MKRRSIRELAFQQAIAYMLEVTSGAHQSMDVDQCD